jgi:hypothetical protein
VNDSGQQLSVAEVARALSFQAGDKPVICQGWPVVGVRNAGAVVELEVLVDRDVEDTAS